MDPSQKMCFQSITSHGYMYVQPRYDIATSAVSSIRRIRLWFLSHVSPTMLTRDWCRNSVRPSVRHAPVSYRNGLTYYTIILSSAYVSLIILVYSILYRFALNIGGVYKFSNFRPIYGYKLRGKRYKIGP